MTAPPVAACPECGRPRLVDAAAQGLCPACLFTIAAAIEDEAWPYQVLAPIEQDAEGITYLAERFSHGVRGLVALKVIVGGNGAAMRARCLELQPALARLPQAGAAKALDAGTTPDGSGYVASEYVAGPTLSELLSRQALGRDERAEIARQMTVTVAAAHGAGVLHLDLGGSRVRVLTAGDLRASITGFGVRAIVAGAGGSQEIDRLALEALIRKLHL